MLVVGAGQSAAEIVVEVSRVASQTFISGSLRHSRAAALDRRKPYDARDIDPLNRIPWRLMNLIYSRRVAQELGSAREAFFLCERRRSRRTPCAIARAAHKKSTRADV